jgi:hypothetical protein
MSAGGLLALANARTSVPLSLVTRRGVIFESNDNDIGYRSEHEDYFNDE